MNQNKMIPVAVRIACLTIAAYVLAQAAAMVVKRSFDAAALRNAVTTAQNPLERVVPPLSRRTRSDRATSASVPKTGAGFGVKVEQVSDTQWVLDRSSLLASTRNLNRFLMQARAVPCRKEGRTAGFRITGISSGSLYEKIGLQNGDVLLRVNTRNLDNPAKLLSLYQEMRNKQHISLLLSRNGQDQMFNYDIR